MLAPGKGKTHPAFMRVIAGGKEKDPSNRIYGFKTNRKHEHVLELIGDYSAILHSDKYGAYEKLAVQKKIHWCPCFSHIRRKFFEAESGDLKFRNWCLRKIRYLFLFERIAWSRIYLVDDFIDVHFFSFFWWSLSSILKSLIFRIFFSILGIFSPHDIAICYSFRRKNPNLLKKITEPQGF